MRLDQLAAQVPSANELKIAEIKINPQVRGEFDQAAIEDLAESIQKVGLLQPVVVKKLPKQEGNYKYELVAGERRLRAFEHLAKITIPVVYTDYSGSTEKVAKQLAENHYRENLTIKDWVKVAADWLKQNPSAPASKITSDYSISTGWGNKIIRAAKLCLSDGSFAALIEEGVSSSELSFLIKKYEDEKVIKDKNLDLPLPYSGSADPVVVSDGGAEERGETLLTEDVLLESPAKPIAKKPAEKIFTGESPAGVLTPLLQNLIKAGFGQDDKEAIANLPPATKKALKTILNDILVII